MDTIPNSPLAKALDHYQTAEHLFYKTLPLAKDPKLLFGIVKSISNSLELTLEHILAAEKIIVPEGLPKKINAVRPFIKKYHMSNEDVAFMLRVHEIIYRQKQSPIEFKRGNRHIICSGDYDLEIVSAREVENFLQHAKKILRILN